jgi:hypothetical protein
MKTERRWRLVLEGLVALDLGALAAALNLALLSRVDRETAEVLLWPKTLISGVLGDLKGWSDHIKSNDPFGLGVQLIFVAVVFGVLALVALRAFGIAAWGDRGVTLFPGVLALIVPWLVWLLAGTAIAEMHPTEVIHFVLLAILLLVVAVTLCGAVSVHRGRWRSQWAFVILGLAGSLVLWLAAVDRWMSFYSAPAAYCSLAISLLLYLVWVSAIERGRRIVAPAGPTG